MIERAAVCMYFKPISYSRNDTEETIEQIIDYLLVYEEVCQS